MGVGGLRHVPTRGTAAETAHDALVEWVESAQVEPRSLSGGVQTSPPALDPSARLPAPALAASGTAPGRFPWAELLF